MFGSVFRRGSAVLVGLAVAAALGVGLVSPATAAGPLPALVEACGSSSSSVTACPANVLMLKEAGLLSMPAATGGTVGVVAQTNTAGSAMGGALGLLSGLAATWGLSQLFNAGGTKVQAGGVLGADGTHDLTITPNADPPGATSSADYSTNAGAQSCVNGVCAVVTGYGMRPRSGTAGDPVLCLKMPGTADKSVVAAWTGTVEFSATLRSAWPVGGGCPGAAQAGQLFAELDWYFNGNDTARPLKYWKVSGAPSNTLPVPPAQKIQPTPGVFKIHTWCADPVNPGGPLVDYMTAQAATLKKGQSVNLADQKCPSGKAAADASIDWTPDAGGGTTQILPPKGEAAARADPAIAANIANPGCANGSCVLQLTKKSGESCGTIGQLCPDWAKDPSYSDNYQCKFGGVIVGIDSCSVYRAPRVGVQPNTKDDGSPYRPTDPAVTPGGQTVHDPNATPDPVTGVRPAPPPTSVVPANPGSDQQNCAPESWIAALNPFNLFVSVGCAIKNAFTPKSDISGDGGKLKDKAMTKAPLSWIAAIGATAPTSVGGQGQCPAWVVNISQTVNHQQTNFSKNIVCQSSFIQAIVNARPVLFGLISAGMLWPFLRSLWYAMIPVVRVIPTGGK